MCFLSTDEVGVLNANIFGDESGPIFLDSIHCTGTESVLSDCADSTLHMCSHLNDVAIICHRKCPVLHMRHVNAEYHIFSIFFLFLCHSCQ